MTVSREHQLLLTAVVIHAIGVEVLVVLPAFVHGLVEHMGFSDAQSGRIAALENGGMAVSTLAMTYFWNRVPWRTVCLVGLGLTAAAFTRSRGAAAVVVCDVNPERTTLSSRFGATHVARPEGGELAHLLRTLTSGRGADGAFRRSAEVTLLDPAPGCGCRTGNRRRSR